MPRFIAALVLFCSSICSPGVAAAQGTDSTGHAVELFNAARYPEESQYLLQIIPREPNNFYAYRLLWEALSHIQSDEEVQLRTKKDLKFLSGVPQADRSEFFYETYEYGLHLTGNNDEESKMHQEQLRRYPKGRAMEFFLLSQARSEQNPVKSARMYEKLAADYKSRIGTASTAKRERFDVIKNHPQDFTPEMLFSAASAWSESELVFAKQADQPFSYISALEEIAGSFVTSAPKNALEYCNLAMQYIDQTWPDTTLYDEEYTVTFWPLELEARVQDHQWQSAKRVGDHLEPYLEKGRLLPSARVSRKQEAKLRAEYGLALEMSGEPETALKQFGLASILDESRLQELSDFMQRNKQFQKPLRSYQNAWRQALDAELQQRDIQLREDVLSKEVHLTAEPFTLPSFSDGSVSLESFKGKPLVLVFWASWCSYCNQELDDLEKLLQAQPPDSFSIVAVSIDTDRDLARQFIKSKTLPFTLAFADGKIDAAYQTEVIPQLYVLDEQGSIRFHVAGIPEADFGKTLGLMLKTSVITADAKTD
jgi:cytochrome c biogenesis protein CcmG, thiol:disulfide interchange protein DsbE